MGAPSRATTIGVVTLTASDDAYERGVGLGISEIAHERGARLIWYAIDGVREGFDAFVSARKVDGLIVLSGSIAQAVGQKAVEQFCALRRPLPMVSVAMELAGIPTIRADNEKGIVAGVDHLVGVHGRRRIGFIHGPEESVDFAARFSAYLQSLGRHGIAFEATWAAPHLPLEAGAESVRILFDERRLGLDALVAVNDSLAIGAVHALLDRGIGVPQDVAVIGFDDIAEASDIIPPLTTVTQNLREQGRRAAELLLEIIDGAVAPEQLLLGTELVVRGSCGCLPRSVLDARAGHPLPLAAAREPIPKVSLESELVRVLSDVDVKDDVASNGRLLDAFFEDLSAGSSRAFISALDRSLSRVVRRSSDLSRWQRAISAMRRISVSALASDETARRHADDLWYEAQALVGETARRTEALARLTARTQERSLGAISQSLIMTTNFEELTSVLAEGLPHLQIKSCYVSLYEESREHARLAVGAHEKNGPVRGHLGVRFRSEELVPREVFWGGAARSLLVMPLSFKNEQLGFVVFEAAPGSAGAFDELRRQFGAALKRLLGERELLRMHAQERERTLELERAYEALAENQEKLLTSEKMALLGRLTAGIAHEMNTPLAAVRAALGELKKLTSEYKESIGDADVTRADHQEIADEMESSIRLAAGAAERVADFVRGIKSETRNLVSTESRVFNAVSVVEDTLLLLNHAARKAGCAFTFSRELDRLELYGEPGRLSQVVTNLVTNAIDASGEKGGGPIALRLSRCEEGLELSVADKGSGIPPEDLKKIFNPMFTSKPFGVGTGLGLTIVSEIVTGHFNGTIRVESDPGVGTTFVVRLARRDA